MRLEPSRETSLFVCLLVCLLLFFFFGGGDKF